MKRWLRRLLGQNKLISNRQPNRRLQPGKRSRTRKQRLEDAPYETESYILAMRFPVGTLDGFLRRGRRPITAPIVTASRGAVSPAALQGVNQFKCENIRITDQKIRSSKHLTSTTGIEDRWIANSGVFLANKTSIRLPDVTDGVSSWR